MHARSVRTRSVRGNLPLAVQSLAGDLDKSRRRWALRLCRGSPCAGCSRRSQLLQLFHFFFSVVGVWVSRVSVDGLCPEEGFKGVRVSRSIAVVVLVGF